MKKKAFISLLFLCSFVVLFAQQKIETYQAFIYTDENIDDLIDESIEQLFAESQERSLFLDAVGSSVKGISLGYVSSALDLGINAVGSLITKKSENKKKWAKIVNTESTNSISIGTILGVKDFYARSSSKGALDPSGMKFSGIGCLKKNKEDTAFFVSCHINKDKIDRIVNHSKFELVLDTLIINPQHSEVPKNKTSRDSSFPFNEREYLEIKLDIKITSSWMTQIATLQNEQQLGKFKINIRLTEKDLTPDGVFKYIRTDNDSISKYCITGESFIVPRSYSTLNDIDYWGTGEYKVDIKLTQRCGTSKEFEKNWKKDWKRRKEIEAKKKKNGTFVDQVWQYFRKQEWDANAKKWVITTLKAPADAMIEEYGDKHDIEIITPSSSK